MIVKCSCLSCSAVTIKARPYYLFEFQYSVLPGVDLADRDVEACSNVFHCLVTLGDDAHTLSNGLGCDWVVTSHHDNLDKDNEEVREERKGEKDKM